MDRGLRRRFTEPEWAGALAICGDPDVPEWAAALVAMPEEVGLEPDAALREVIRLRDTALVEVEVTAVAKDRGVLAALWTDGRVGSGIVRGVDVAPPRVGPGSRMRPGIELSAFPVGSLVDEVMRLVPPAPNLIGATRAILPEELTITLSQALRRADARVIDAVCRDLGIDRPPVVLDSVVHTMDGQLTLTVPDQGAGS